MATEGSPAAETQVVSWRRGGTELTVESPLTPLPDSHPTNEIILALVGGRPRIAPYPAGTAVAIAPGLALTARHVLDGFWDYFHQPRHEHTAGFAVQALQYLPNLPTPILWHVTEAYDSDHLDIAVLRLIPGAEVPAHYTFPYPTLDVTPPDVGTEVQALGYPHSQVSFEQGRGWTLLHQPAGSVGLVTQVFPIFRDHGMLAFPSFEMSLHVESGMSGGPVFDRPGHLRGIVCSSLQPDMVPSWASTLWPSMALPAEPRPNAHNGYDRLLHLARDGRLHALNIDRLRLPSDDADVRQWAIS